MIVNVLKDFTFSRNGIHAECAVKGTPVDIPDELLIGLMTERYVAVPDAVPTPVVIVDVSDQRTDKSAPVVISATTFDPSTATLEELQTFLRSKGIQFHHKAGVEKLRALVSA